MARKTNKTCIAVKMQTEAGTFDTPSTATDLLAISNLQFSIQGVTVANNEYTGTIHKSGDDLAGKVVTGSFNINLRPPGGSDVPAADAWVPGRILRAAKFTEVRTTSAVPSSPEALGSGSTTSIAKLGASAVGTAGLYKSMALLLSGIASNAYDVFTAIRAYDASKNATIMETQGSSISGNWQIPKQLSYQRDITEANAPFLSAQLWIDGLRYDLVDFGISSLRLSMPVSTRDGASTPMFEVGFTCTIDDYDDEATPTIPAAGATPLFKDGKMYLAGKSVGGSSMSVDFGIRNAYPPNPNYTDGSEGGEIVESRTTMSMDRLAYLKAYLDTLNLAEQQTIIGAFAQWGYTSGKMVQVVASDVRLNYQSPNLGQDFVTEQGDMWIDVTSKNLAINFPYF